MREIKNCFFEPYAFPQPKVQVTSLRRHQDVARYAAANRQSNNAYFFVSSQKNKNNFLSSFFLTNDDYLINYYNKKCQTVIHVNF